MYVCVCMCVSVYHNYYQVALTARIPLLFLSFIIRPYRPSLLTASCVQHKIYEYRFLLVGQSWCGDPQVNFTFEFVPVSQAVPNMSCSFYLDDL